MQRGTARGITVARTTAGRDFQQVSAPRVAAAPVIHSVVATTLAHALESPADYPGAQWYWAKRDGRVTALAMHTPPRPFHVATVDTHVARAIGRRVLADGLQVERVGGLVTGALAFAETIAFESGGHIRVVRREGMHDLPRPPRHPEGVPGELRAARESDIPLLDTWARAYLEETGTEAPPRFPLQQWVSRGDMRVWDVDGEPVAMTHASRPTAASPASPGSTPRPSSAATRMPPPPSPPSAPCSVARATAACSTPTSTPPRRAASTSGSAIAASATPASWPSPRCADPGALTGCADPAPAPVLGPRPAPRLTPRPDPTLSDLPGRRDRSNVRHRRQG